MKLKLQKHSALKFVVDYPITIYRDAETIQSLWLLETSESQVSEA